MNSANKKAVALLSGGLDSALAIRMMQNQGFEVLSLHFVNPWEDPKAKENGKAAQSAKKLNVEMRLITKGPDYINLLRSPKHGYGSGMNPCIDCRIHLLRTAKTIMEHESALCIITGEVLGQRPMSQMRPQLDLIERESGTRGVLLRPLCAHYFPPTRVEEAGLIDRTQLLKLNGRGRGPQLEMAKRFGLESIESGGPGCLLTDPVYAQKAKDLYAHRGDVIDLDYRLLAVGRHFRLDNETKAVVARDLDEADKLATLLRPGQTLFEPDNFDGPSVLLDGDDSARNLRRIFMILGAYTKPKKVPDPNHATLLVKRHKQADEHFVFEWRPVSVDELDPWRLG